MHVLGACWPGKTKQGKGCPFKPSLCSRVWDVDTLLTVEPLLSGVQLQIVQESLGGHGVLSGSHHCLVLFPGLRSGNYRKA